MHFEAWNLIQSICHYESNCKPTIIEISLDSDHSVKSHSASFPQVFVVFFTRELLITDTIARFSTLEPKMSNLSTSIRKRFELLSNCCILIMSCVSLLHDLISVEFTWSSKIVASLCLSEDRSSLSWTKCFSLASTIINFRCFDLSTIFFKTERFFTAIHEFQIKRDLLSVSISTSVIANNLIISSSYSVLISVFFQKHAEFGQQSLLLFPSSGSGRKWIFRLEWGR